MPLKFNQLRERAQRHLIERHIEAAKYKGSDLLDPLLVISPEQSALTQEEKQVSDFVQGKTATAPSFKLKAKPSKPSSGDTLARMLGKAPRTDSIIKEDRLLHGTGFTKKAAERSDAAIARAKQHLGNRDAERVANARKVFETPLADPKAANLAKVPVPQAPTLPDTRPYAELFAEAGLEYDESQAAALEGLAKQKYAVLIGPAGCGKTQIEILLLKILQHQAPTVDWRRTSAKGLERALNHDAREDDYKPAIGGGCFMGRAVQQMKRSMPREYHHMLRTIHATLGYQPTDVEVPDELGDDGNPITWKIAKRFRPYFTATNKLPYAIFFADEIGTLTIQLWNELVAALPSNCRIFMIGDINQLTPVQGRSPLGFAMLKWPTYELTKIHRNAGVIVHNAHKGKSSAESRSLSLKQTLALKVSLSLSCVKRQAHSRKHP